MSTLKDQFPHYLLDRERQTSTVIVTALFTLVFLLLTVPFSQDAWFRLESGGPFMFTVSYLVVSVLVVIVSRTLMCRFGGVDGFTYMYYILWLVLEVVLISIIYAAFTCLGVRTGAIAVSDGRFWSAFVECAVKVTFCIGIPAAGCDMYFALQEMNNTMRVTNYGDVVSDVPVTPQEEQRITLFDNSGVLKFSIRADSLYFIESDDNYIQVWYRDSSGEVKRYMLRCRLKTVEESFSGSDLVRCHRKYVVNLRNVKILKSEKDGYQIDLGLVNVPPLPISKTYEKAVLARFNNSR